MLTSEQDELIKLKEQLERIEQEQSNGAKYYTLDELDASLRKIIKSKSDSN